MSHQTMNALLYTYTYIDIRAYKNINADLVLVQIICTINFIHKTEGMSIEITPKIVCLHTTLLFISKSVYIESYISLISNVIKCLQMYFS